MSENKSKNTVIQTVKSNRGVKPSPDITRVVRHRKKVEETFLSLYLKNDLDVDSSGGFATLARYLYSLHMFYNKSGKPISVNTIRQELTEISAENRLKNPRSARNKKK